MPSIFLSTIMPTLIFVSLNHFMVWKVKASKSFSASFCDPLGDWNVWGTLYPMTKPLAEKEVVLISSKVVFLIVKIMCHPNFTSESFGEG